MTLFLTNYFLTMINKILLLSVSVLAMSTTASAQNWIDMGPFPPDESFTEPTHGIAVDGEGKVWIDQSSRTPIIVDGDTLKNASGTVLTSGPIYVYNPDGEMAMDPIHEIQGDTLGTFPELFVGGLQTDHNGDIIVAIRTNIPDVDVGGRLYRIDHTTGMVSGSTVLNPISPASPGIDDAGNIYVAQVGAVGSAITIYDSEFSLIGNVVPPKGVLDEPIGKPGVGRNLSVSADGNYVYWAYSIAGTKHGLVKYSRPTEFSGYETEFRVTETDTTGFVHEGLVSESSTRHPTTGHIWFGNAPACCTGAGGDANADLGLSYFVDYSIMTWYALDPATDEIVDSLHYNLPIEYSGQHTRAIGFSPDGNYAYVGIYDPDGVPSVKKFMRADVTSIQRDPSEIPQGFTLSQNYPNPFNPQTNIEFEMKDAGLATLKVYDVLGREVATLVDEHLVAGKYTATFNATSLSSGTYVYQLDVTGHRLSGKMMLMK